MNGYKTVAVKKGEFLRLVSAPYQWRGKGFVPTREAEQFLSHYEGSRLWPVFWGVRDANHPGV